MHKIWKLKHESVIDEYILIEVTCICAILHSINLDLLFINRLKFVKFRQCFYDEKMAYRSLTSMNIKGLNITSKSNKKQMLASNLYVYLIKFFTQQMFYQQEIFVPSYMML